MSHKDSIKARRSFEPRLYSTPQPLDFTAVALRRLAFPPRFGMRHRLALGRQLEPQLPARLGLAVERLRNPPPSLQTKNSTLKSPLLFFSSLALSCQQWCRAGVFFSFKINPPSSQAPAAKERALKKMAPHTYFFFLRPWLWRSRGPKTPNTDRTCVLHRRSRDSQPAGRSVGTVGDHGVGLLVGCAEQRVRRIEPNVAGRAAL